MSAVDADLSMSLQLSQYQCKGPNKDFRVTVDFLVLNIQILSL